MSKAKRLMGLELIQVLQSTRCGLFFSVFTSLLLLSMLGFIIFLLIIFLGLSSIITCRMWMAELLMLLWHGPLPLVPLLHLPLH